LGNWVAKLAQVGTLRQRGKKGRKSVSLPEKHTGGAKEEGSIGGFCELKQGSPQLRASEKSLVLTAVKRGGQKEDSLTWAVSCSGGGKAGTFTRHIGLDECG